MLKSVFSTLILLGRLRTNSDCVIESHFLFPLFLFFSPFFPWLSIFVAFLFLFLHIMDTDTLEVGIRTNETFSSFFFSFPFSLLWINFFALHGYTYQRGQLLLYEGRGRF